MLSLSSVTTAVAALSWIVVGSAAPLQVRQSDYPWLSQASGTETLASRISAPPGFERESVTPGSFEDWLRNLPLKKGRPPVQLYNGRPKANQNAHAAVVDIDTGNKDLQQCADAVIRLRAEYLYSSTRSPAFTSTLPPATLHISKSGLKDSVRSCGAIA